MIEGDEVLEEVSELQILSLHAVVVNGRHFLFLDDIAKTLGLRKDESLSMLAIYVGMKDPSGKQEKTQFEIDFEDQSISTGLSFFSTENEQTLVQIVASTLVKIKSCASFYKSNPESAFHPHKPLFSMGKDDRSSIDLTKKTLAEMDEETENKDPRVAIKQIPLDFEQFLSWCCLEKHRRQQPQSFEITPGLSLYVSDNVDESPSHWCVHEDRVEEMSTFVTPQSYTLAIADAPYGFCAPNSVNDDVKYGVSAYKKVIEAFGKVTTFKANGSGLRMAFMQRFGACKTFEKLWERLCELRLVNVFEYGEYELEFTNLWDKWVATLAIGERAPDFLKRDCFVARLCPPLKDKVKARFPITFEAAREVARLKERKLSLDAKGKAKVEEEEVSLPKSKGMGKEKKQEEVDAMPIKRARQEETTDNEADTRRKIKESAKSSKKKKTKPRQKLTIKEFSLGEHEAKSKTRVVPSQRKAIPKMMDTKSMHELMSAPVQCTITLSELLKIRQHAWDEMGKHLEKMGLKIPLQELPINGQSSKTQQECANAKPVLINKVGEYCEGEEGNTTLPMEYKGVKTLAILDSGAGVAIATKEIWKKWDRPMLRKTRMKLQLVDGYTEKPLGILEQIIVTSCGIEYEHTFAIVDFGKGNNFDIILERLFMRHVIHDISSSGVINLQH
ncbi:hypothetical protein L7F22_028267 [Adiantum nelumboides]|nr:hypothetical protein [Adiantum nelumboides]